MSTTVVVLSAGASAHVLNVLRALARCRPQATSVLFVWSGVGPLPSSVLPWCDSTLVVASSSFDHGGTRQVALESCSTEFVAFLSDDAEPANENWLAELTDPLADANVAAVYGRQLARPDASMLEKVFRCTRYPPESGVKLLAGALAIAWPVSDANVVYRASALRELGGFPRPCGHGEDQVLAARALAAGWKLQYAPEAVVWHSHPSSMRDMFRRGWHAGSVTRTQALERRNHKPGVISGGIRFAVRMVITGWRMFGWPGVTAAIVGVVCRAAGLALGGVVRIARS